MRSRSFFVLVSIFVFAGFAIAQRSVTNADLEQYRDLRIRAQADLRENYDRLGFPSPQELARREAERTNRINSLAESLRMQDLDNTRSFRDYESAMANAQAQQVQPEREQPQEDIFQTGQPIIISPYGGGYGAYYDIFGRPRYRPAPRYRGWGH